MNKTLKNILNFDLKSLFFHLTNKVNTPFFTSFFISFFALNIIFLYHSTNFLIGDHDWKYLQNGISLSDGVFEGRFTQFIFINILSLGKILPILNNLLGFLGFSLGISLLAKYWKLPSTKTTYTIFSLFCTITPFILSFMYFAFIIIPCLSWNFIVISALIISAKEQTFSLTKTLLSVLLITFSLGGYPPVINLIATAFSTRLFIDAYFFKSSLNKLIKDYSYTIINIILSIIIYKLCLHLLTITDKINPNYYNLQTIGFDQYFTKFFIITTALFKQFSITLPFITFQYKFLTLTLTILAIISLFPPLKQFFSIHPQKLQSLKSFFLKLFLFIIIFYSPLLTLFLSQSTKETAFTPRIDFFGLIYLYSAMFMLTLKSTNQLIRNLGILLAILTILTSSNQLFEAQKVWKLGYDAELKTYKRIINTYEQFNTFNNTQKYTIINAGYLKLRTKFYHTPFQKESDDLLNISYIPGLNAGTALKYQTVPAYISDKAYAYTFIPDQKFLTDILNADTWPSPNSVTMGNNWIMIIINHEALKGLRKNYLFNN